MPANAPPYRLATAQWATLAGFLAVAIALSISPPYPHELLLQHIPTVVALVLLLVAWRRGAIGPVSFTLVMVFLGFHALGARYLYSYVPYDDWAYGLFGVRISETFGFERNHYDRLIHLLYGLLLAPVARDVARRRGVRAGFADYIAVESIMATSLLYELFEWWVALALSPESAEAYNGQQGDPWDAQKDMALATAGALLTVAGIRLRRTRRSARAD